jgi:hypothetical protein
MNIQRTSHPIIAIVYSMGSSFERFLGETTAVLIADGVRLAGLVQHSEPRPGRAKCDMFLRDLSTGQLHGLSEDRGPEARGCVLDVDRLLAACEVARRGLSNESDLLVLSKFGKAETEGGGFRSLISSALDLSVPVLIGVPEINLEAFRTFAAGLAHEIEFSSLGEDRPAAFAIGLSAGCSSQKTVV